MARKREKLIAAAVAASLVVLAVVAVLFTEFDSPELGRLALGQVGKASGLDLQAKGFRDLRGLGTSTFKLQASGESSDLARVLGKGELTINGGELPDHPALAQVEQLLGNVALIGAGYEAFPLEFDIRTGLFGDN